MTDEEHLIQVYESNLNTEKIIFDKIYNEDGGRYNYVPSYEGRNKISMLHTFFLERDNGKTKQCCYNVGRVAEYMSNIYDWRIIDSGIDRISYALLSDCEELIQRYSVLRNTINHELNIGFQLPNAVQNILLNNWDKLEGNIRNLERFVKVPRFKWWAETVDVFKGFLNKDARQIEDALLMLIQTHKKRNTDPLISKFFSIDTAGLCKLAWRQGYEIDLKSSLVPIELMPVKPLEYYEDYDFLKT